MIEYLEIINKIKDIKEEAIIEFNQKVNIPLALSNLNSIIKQEDKNIIIEKNSNKVELDLYTRKSFFEIICILKKIDVELYKKIDFKYIDFFEKFKYTDCEFTIENENFETVQFSELTLKFLAIINIKFWCELDEEKKEFLENMKCKPLIKDCEKKPKQNINNEEKNQPKVENLEIVKNTWWLKLLNKFRRLKK